VTFAAPLLLLGLALLVPALVAFLVRRRRHVLRVPSTLLWRLAGATTAQNRRFRSIKRLASLIACLCGLAALVLAAARPSGKNRGETVAIVIDASASMDAGGRGSPLVQARRFAAKIIAGGGPGDRYAIIAAGPAPARLAGPITAGPVLDEALEKLHTERGAADVEAAIDLAGSLVAGSTGARIVLLGDGGETAGGLLAVREVPVTQRMFPPLARENLGIASFAARAVTDGPADEREALVTVATSSDRPRAGKVIVTAEGRELGRRRVEIPARGEAEVRVRVLASAGRITARVEPDDGMGDALATDDEATLTGGLRPPPRVLLVSTAGEAQAAAVFFVEKALLAAGATEIVHVPPSMAGVEIGANDVLVALGEGPQTRADVPALYLGTVTGALPFTGFHPLAGEGTKLRSLEARDPILRGVALDGVTIEKATAVAPPPGARALVDLDGGTVMLAGGAGRSAFVYLGIDPAQSDLVLRVAFPVLVANALHALGGAADVVVADTVARSEITLAAPPPADGPVEPDSRWRLPVSPAVLLAFLGAALLALEAWTFRRGWAG
jgi:hypothetical protein